MKDSISYIELSNEIYFREELLTHMEANAFKDEDRPEDYYKLKHTVEMLKEMRLFLAKMSVGNAEVLMSKREKGFYLWIIKTIIRIRGWRNYFRPKK